VYGYTVLFIVKIPRHRGLKRLVESNEDRELRRDLVARSRVISVSGNWRITFKADGDEITELDLEDYH
jgi:hypothetical protein